MKHAAESARVHCTAICKAHYTGTFHSAIAPIACGPKDCGVTAHASHTRKDETCQACSKVKP